MRGQAARYMEQLAEDKNRGSMAWRCWQIGGYRCGNVTRQAFDAATGLPVRVTDNPMHATIEGVGIVLGELEYLSKAKKR